MASQQAGQEIPHREQAQPVSDAVMQQALDNLANSQSAQNNTGYTSQATEFMQQKGEQVKNMAQGAGEQVKNVALGAGEQVMNMAQGATDAVKNTLGMNTDNTNTATPTGAGGACAGAGAGTTSSQPSSLTAEQPSNPTNNINIGSSTINPRV